MDVFTTSDYESDAFIFTDLTDLTTDTDDYESDLGGLCNKELVRQFSKTFEPPLYWIIFVVGAFGNLLVICIFTTVQNRLKTMTDVYLLNLAVADLLFLGTLPFWATNAAQGWVFSQAICKGVSAVYKINFFASMLLLTCISVDRYIAIVHVTKAHNYKNKRMLYSKITCVFVWLASCLLALPEFIFAKVKNIDPQSTSCVMVYSITDNNRTKVLVLALQISVGFLFPLLVIVLCYSVIIRKLLQARSFEKHKALRVIFAVVAAFVLSQLPFSGYLIIEAGQANNATITNCEVMQSVDMAGQIVKCLAYTHCCLNPILYVFIGVRFRKYLFSLLQRMSCGLGLVNNSKLQQVPKRPSVMSDTDTTPVFSL
ncbi:C-C chemokine receptor type 9-like isoform X1 [Sinocyclocheilus anshuiensis]|uniref:C-C chemokine receptor type 9-like n=1 Tax=Sinocyclocheilus anshuiensis TaxID=1608454 RepID=A0A671M931_9TELE|nr:PREDICTED: C-C chemokine receptor type 9-like isoform X1 [Sinocyclocheilus anshuiensis]